MSEFTPRPAVKRAQSLKVGILGFENAGKTLSALKLARGMVGSEGSVVAIDTHGGQVEEYVGHDEVGAFAVIDVRPPFRPDRILEAFKAACDFGADAIVIDSMSHEWDGDGGVVDWAGEIEADLERRNKKIGVGVWKKPKMAHKRLVSHTLGVVPHVIYCLRMKTTTSTSGTKSSEVAGDKDLPYDLTLHMVLNRDDHTVEELRVNDRYKGLIPMGALITSDHGRALAEEASRGVVDSDKAIIARMEDAARHGTVALRRECELIRGHDKALFAHFKAIPGLMDRLGSLAAEADAKAGDLSSPVYAPQQLDLSDDPSSDFGEDFERVPSEKDASTYDALLTEGALAS